MAIFKPATTTTPLVITATGTYSVSPREIVSIHYLNTTAGVGRVDITDGIEANKGITLGAGIASGTDHWYSAQPATFRKIIVTFTTGTGVVTIQTN